MVAVEHGLERLRLLHLGMLRAQRLDAVEREGELEADPGGAAHSGLRRRTTTPGRRNTSPRTPNCAPDRKTPLRGPGP